MVYTLIYLNPYYQTRGYDYTRKIPLFQRILHETNHIFSSFQHHNLIMAEENQRP